MVLTYTVTLFFSALLLFVVEPLTAKAVLPLLGGTPAVWNTCMLFYQTALLAGYVYAHVSVTRLGARRQAVLHCLLLALVLLALPIGLPPGITPPAEGLFSVWLFGLMARTIGAPFLLLSATAPLLQMWFADTGAPGSRDPYHLYAASNLGSMTALIAYPLLIEPRIGLAAQDRLWSLSFVLLCGLILFAAIMLLASRRRGARRDTSAAIADAPLESAPEAEPPAAVDWRLRARWLALAFCPSSLLLGVTTYLTTDVAAIPLFWVVPLALYLLTFVLVFARRKLLPHGLMVRLQPYIVLPLLLTLVLSRTATWWLFLLHLAGFFVTAMVCHGELAKSRPAVSRLTEYYVIMSVGGMLGGLFNALLAPVLFNSLIEYPLIMAAACLLRPAPAGQALRARDWAVPLAAWLVLAACIRLAQRLDASATVLQVVIGLGLLLAFSAYHRPLRFGLALIAVVLATGGMDVTHTRSVAATRNFFGVLRVVEETVPGVGSYRSMLHGHTIHGVQRLDAEQDEPLSYYHRGGPLGQLFAALAPARQPRSIAAVGLGIGTVAAYCGPDQQLDFYEINPAVARLARDRRYFSLLTDCAPDSRIVLGDARLTLAKAPDAAYDLIILDAFSSDAIPLHLVTREALEIYLGRLAPGGLVMFHVSNRYLDLIPALAALAKELSLAGRWQDCPTDKAETDAQKVRSTWVVMGRTPVALAILDGDPRWKPLPENPGIAPWTDDYSNIFDVIEWTMH